MNPSEFKEAYPIHYWFRLLMFAYGILVVSYLALSSEAEGSGYPYMEPFEAVIDEDPLTNG